MVRLMLVLAPVMCILSGIAVSSMLSTYMRQIDEVKTEKKKTKFEGNYFMRSEVGGFAGEWQVINCQLPIWKPLIQFGWTSAG